MARIAFLNPNATDRMTQEMVGVARDTAGNSSQIVGYTNSEGPAAIQGAEDAAVCLPGLHRIAAHARQGGAEALVIGCFDDTGLGDLRLKFDCPVIGLGEAGCLLASVTRPAFVVVTTTKGSVPEISRNIDTMGLGPRCRGVVPAHVPVLDLPNRIDTLRGVLRAEAERQPQVALVLGCAGMAPLRDLLAEALPAPVVDPVRAATRLALSALDAGGRSPATLGATA